MAIKTVFITSGTTFTIPSDFGSLVSVEAIGGGGGSWRGEEGEGWRDSNLFPLQLR